MAYVAFDETGLARLPESVAQSGGARARRDLAPVGFTGLEWSVVALARFDPLSSLRRPGRISRAIAAMIGLTSSNRLSDDRLEALRRMAVLAWHQGDAVPPAELTAFLGAGFSQMQYHVMLARIGMTGGGRSRA